MAEELETAQIPPHIMAAMRERMKMAQRMSRIKHKIVVMSGKGGVGKSSVAANLAVVLAEDGAAGIVDADVTGPDIPMLMGVQDAQVKATDTGMEPTVGPAGVKVISMAQLIDRDTA
ncbi:MAG TPA: P-loop NTPase, partial [Thermoplasmata archaeon]|nr:P-loop NTPase [Thermoplasmata archaeon]